VYVTHAINFPVLKTFAREQNFNLNIRVAALRYQNGDELNEIETSSDFSVEALKKKDYTDLAAYLDIPQAAIDRDEQTESDLIWA